MTRIALFLVLIFAYSCSSNDTEIRSKKYKTFVLGGRDPNDIRGKIVQNIDRFRDCYKGFKNNDEIKQFSRGTLNFNILNNGDLSNVGFILKNQDKSDKRTSMLVSCIEKTMKSISFVPKVKGYVEVSQPTEFFPELNKVVGRE